MRTFGNGAVHQPKIPVLTSYATRVVITARPFLNGHGFKAAAQVGPDIPGKSWEYG